jgi:hypothetical protein
MIFDTIIYGTFTADDFINAQLTSDFSKFTPLPIDIRKKFISDVIDKHPNKENKNFKQAAFDFIDGKITEKQFRDAWWKYRVVAIVAAQNESVVAIVVAGAMAMTAVVVAMAAMVAMTAVAAAVAAMVAMAAEYYRPQLEQHVKHLNKLIQEYE